MHHGPWTREEIETAVARFRATHPGHRLTALDFRAANGLPSYDSVRRCFGSLTPLTGLVQGGMPQEDTGPEPAQHATEGDWRPCQTCGKLFQRGVTWLKCVRCWRATPAGPTVYHD